MADVQRIKMHKAEMYRKGRKKESETLSFTRRCVYGAIPKSNSEPLGCCEGGERMEKINKMKLTEKTENLPDIVRLNPEDELCLNKTKQLPPRDLAGKNFGNPKIGNPYNANFAE